MTYDNRPFGDRPPAGLAEGAIGALVVGITIGLGLIYWATSSHTPVATAQSPAVNQAAPTTTGQGGQPSALDKAGKTDELKERRATQDTPGSETSKPAFQDSNVPPGAPQNK